MDKQTFVKAIATKTGSTQSAVEEFLKAQADVINEVVAAGDEVKVAGIKISTKDVAERAYPIPGKPGETKTVAAHRAPKLSVLQALKDAAKQ
ncbi:integration host factor (IHF)-like DNA-binding domain protein [Vibrio phage 1.244.A._10N.261.54.C3]|nr:integration host factor (IHF)-like DNA-binding domain protein [Vibrio phage 1.244.A._10N.261.54.C3]AUR98825.1 integration host factor (IHF)-like DNA-binding domain protein [Vibrio phage 1.255.O._10N.286.45.F1]